MNQQIDIAVDLGALPPALPEIVTLQQFATASPAAPPHIIEGILHRGCKMVLGGTSKSNKSWGLLDLALFVVSGQPWWERRCENLPVVYVNFELHDWAIAQRVNALCVARPECQGMAGARARTARVGGDAVAAEVQHLEPEANAAVECDKINTLFKAKPSCANIILCQSEEIECLESPGCSSLADESKRMHLGDTFVLSYCEITYWWEDGASVLLM